MVSLTPDSQFEICLNDAEGGGNNDRKLVYDEVNDYFKVLKNAEQLDTEYHLVRFNARIYMNECAENGEQIMLTIRPHTTSSFRSPELKKFLLTVDQEDGFRDGKGNVQHFGRVHMEGHLQTLEDLDHVQLQMICG